MEVQAVYTHELLLASSRCRIDTLRGEAECVRAVREGRVGHGDESTVTSVRPALFVVCEWAIGRLLQSSAS